MPAQRIIIRALNRASISCPYVELEVRKEGEEKPTRLRVNARDLRNALHESHLPNEDTVEAEIIR